MGETECKQAVSEDIWLNYFNQTLYEKGIISEGARNKMQLKIMDRAARISKRRG